jgi:hypothetical protein
MYIRKQKKTVILENHRLIWSFAFSIDHLHISNLIQKIICFPVFIVVISQIDKSSPFMYAKVKRK